MIPRSTCFWPMRSLMVKKFQQAAEEYQTALTLKPKRPDDVKVKLASALFGSGQKDQAKTTLEKS